MYSGHNNSLQVEGIDHVVLSGPWNNNTTKSAPNGFLCFAKIGSHIDRVKNIH